MTNQPPENEQFIAHIKIEKKVTPQVKINSPLSSSSTSKKEREISEVTQMTIKANTLEKLISKTRAHLELIEED